MHLPHLPHDRVQGHISAPLPLIPNCSSPCSLVSPSLRLRDLSLTEIRELERYDREQEKIESCLCSNSAATVVL